MWEAPGAMANSFYSGGLTPPSVAEDFVHITRRVYSGRVILGWCQLSSVISCDDYLERSTHRDHLLYRPRLEYTYTLMSCFFSCIGLGPPPGTTEGPAFNCYLHHPETILTHPGLTELRLMFLDGLSMLLLNAQWPIQ